MIHCFILFLSLGSNASEYDIEQRYNDSLLIYETYQSQIPVLQSLQETQRQEWYTRELRDDSLTACAKIRLQKFNKQRYYPCRSFDRKGLGVAYAYPKPVLHEYQTTSDFAAMSVPKNTFAITDRQTRFITDQQTNTKTPYIQRMIYENGRLTRIEKLHPLTLEKL
ncbi:MAG: hypothetical protein U0T74_11740 [Chitinophagales bacterium]